MSTHHVMLDLETLGTKPGCPILSIGASKFFRPNEEPHEAFSAAIDSHNQYRMDIQDPETVNWWNAQTQEARDAVFSNPEAVYIESALASFTAWLISLKKTSEDRIIIWGNGAAFDEPILKEAYNRYNLTPVWTFRDSMCFRTLKEIGKMLNVPEPEFEGQKHIAVMDAKHQAKWAYHILLAMGLRP